MEVRVPKNTVTGFAEIHERLTQALFVVCGCHNEAIDNLVDSLVSAADARGEARGRAEMAVEAKINAITQQWLVASEAPPGQRRMLRARRDFWRAVRLSFHWR